MQFCEIHRGTMDKSNIFIETLRSLMGFEISGRGSKGERGKKEGKKRREKKGKKKQQIK